MESANLRSAILSPGLLCARCAIEVNSLLGVPILEDAPAQPGPMVRMKIKKRYWIVLAALTVPALGALWLYGTQWLALRLDPFTAERVTERAISTFGWDGTDLRAASHDLAWESPGGVPDVKLVIDAKGRLTLVDRRDRVALGHRVATIPQSAFPLHPISVFALEPGDRIILTTEQSRIAWPNPFEVNWMTGHSPGWKRYRYYRLGWAKRSGTSIELLWRYEQFYYDGPDGWVDADMTDDDPPCGLIRITIRPPG
jgi:hypothetical protein